MPRYKPCGGGLTAKVRPALDLDFSPAVEMTIREGSIAYGAERLRVRAPTGWCVMRDKFDALLATQAAHAGAELRDGQPVTEIVFDDRGATVSTRQEKLSAAFIVGADGVNGIVRRAAGLAAHRRMAVALEAEMDAPSSTLDKWREAMHLDFGFLPWGYAWIFPKAEHLSIGVGVLARTGRAVDLRAELERYVTTEPSLHTARTRFTRGHRIPLGGQFGRYHAPRAVLVGDAAGVVDPFTAEGIYYAIKSGQMAAEHVGQAFERGAFDLSGYSRRINTEINADFRYAWALTRVFYRLPHLAFHIFSKSVATQTAVGEIASGATYKKVLWKTVQGLVREAARGVRQRR
jgi:geranylgeranyl reductase family protein